MDSSDEDNDDMEVPHGFPFQNGTFKPVLDDILAEVRANIPTLEFGDDGEVSLHILL